MHDPKANSEAKVEAVKVLGRAGADAEAAKWDLIRAGRGSGELHDEAVRALRSVDVNAVDHLVMLLRRKDDEDANAAADVLGELGKDAAPAVPALRRMLVSDDFGVCRRAFNVIEALGPVAAEVAPDLPGLTTNRAWEVRVAAAHALVSVMRDADEGARTKVTALAKTIDSASPPWPTTATSRPRPVTQPIQVQVNIAEDTSLAKLLT